MEKINYQKKLEETLHTLEGQVNRPRLLLHACCAPCSSYVLEYLSSYFQITVFFYNPNISPETEYRCRAQELARLIEKQPHALPVFLLEGTYDPERFFAMAKGLEALPEGGERCFRCYRLRLEETAKMAKEGGFDFFTTTLSISPHKNAQVLNEIGAELASQYGVPYLFSDFKKKNGYRRSCTLSAEYGLYRQNYCGCVYSKLEAQKRDAQKSPSNPLT